MVFTETLSPAELQRELVRDYLTRVGGVPINHLIEGEEYKFAATLSQADGWTRLFPLQGAIESIRIDEVAKQQVGIPDSMVIFMKVVGNKASAILVYADSAGWDDNDLQKGNVYGFEEIPVVIDRARRILKNLRDTNARENAVEFPIDTPNNFGTVRATVESEADLE